MLTDRHLFLAAALLFALVCSTANAWADRPRTHDFAYGCRLPVTDESGLYGVVLPLAVYEKLQQNDMGDLQVFNGAGQPVPHALRHHAPPDDPIRFPIPFFPIPTHPTPQSEDLSLRVERQDDGSILTIVNESRRTLDNGRAYLLDLSGIHTPPSRLELHWPAGNGNALYTVSLLESSDLAHWQPIGGRITLADLEYNGSRVSRRFLTLPGKTKPYLRLDSHGGNDGLPPLQLSGVQGLYGGVSTAESWQWFEPVNSAAETTEGRWVLEYQLQGGLRVSALDLAFPQVNSLARAIIESRPHTEAPWRRVGGGDFFRLDIQGSLLASPFIRCPPTTDRWWRLTLAAGDAGLSETAQLPRLRLGWIADELIFLGRGAGPYTLAFGSAVAKGEVAGQTALILTALQQTGSESRLVNITPGPIHPLGGEQALRPRSAPIPWQRLLLWAVLLGGVGLLATMARSIYREMRAGKP